VRLPLEIRRIVSLAPNLTETVFALGAGDRLVGVTDFCDFPAEAASRTRVGGPMNPSLEQIVALKPDLVLAQANSGNRRETVEALERLGLPVFASNAQTVEQILDSMSNLAGLMGAPASGEKLVADLRTRLVEVKRRLTGRPARRALFVVWHDPLITIGKRTFIADALRWAGAEPAIDLEQDWPRVSLEEVVRVQPEFLVLAGSHSETVQRTVDDLSQRPGWRGLEAVRARRIAIISDAVNRPAPRLVEAIEQLARQLHPDAFEEKPAGGPPPRAEASCNR
jgi:iron complex transport system substrate-binding protein